MRRRSRNEWRGRLTVLQSMSGGFIDRLAMPLQQRLKPIHCSVMLSLPMDRIV